MEELKYHRIVLKTGGEILAGKQDFGVDASRALQLAKRIKNIHDKGVQVAIVMGGGNIWRGAKGAAQGIDRVVADEMGMIATMINCLALADALRKIGLETRLHSSLAMNGVAEPYSRLRAISQLKKYYIVILGAGTGHPYFTTDTAAALRAVELKADILIKGTKVDGIYDKDPEKNSHTKFLEKISYIEYINRDIKILDNNAVVLCMNNNLPILVINLWTGESLEKAILGEKIGSIITK